MIDKAALTRSRVTVLALIAAAVLYKLLNVAGQGTTSLMFVGLPAVLAVIVAFAPPSKSATGTIMKVLTLTLLLGAVLLIEASVCLLMAAPILYAIGAGVGAAVDASRRRHEQPLRVAILVPLLLLSLQGTLPGTSGPRGIEASADRVIDVAAGDIAGALQCPERFDRTLPAFFRWGRFPRPVSCTYTNGRFVIAFEQGEPPHHKLAHTHAERSELVLKITEHRPGLIRFGLVSDTTMMSHWAEFTSSTLQWRAVDRDRTKVRWTIRVERKLDPIWYFAPLQHYAAKRAAAYLIDAVVEASG